MILRSAPANDHRYRVSSAQAESTETDILVTVLKCVKQCREDTCA